MPVSAIGLAVDFYAAIFAQKGTPVSPGRHYFDLEGVILALYDPVADGDELGRPWVFHENQYIYIATEDLDRVYEQFRQAGDGTIDSGIEIMPWGERLFYARDPFGNPICFVDRDTTYTGKD